MKKSKTDSSSVADTNFREYVRYRDHGKHGDYVKRAKRNNDYYLGEQWDLKDKQVLENTGRPALTINLCLNKINVVAGEQISKRMDVSFKAKGNGASDEVSKDLNALFETIFEDNQYEWRETEMFLDGIIEERGFLDLRLDQTDHIAGEARIRNSDNRDILIDPDAKAYDPDTWGGFIETRIYTLDEIELEFGQASRIKLEGLAEAGMHFATDSVTFTSDTTFGGASGRGDTSIDAAEKRRIKLVRVVSRQYYRLQLAKHFVSMGQGDTRLIPAGWSEEKIQDFAGQNGLGIISKMTKRIRWTVSADRVMLHDEWSPYRHFTVIPYFCYFRRGKSAAIMTNLISPQDNLNKLSSQILHVVNSVANSGWIVEEDSMTNMSEDELEANGAKTGVVISYKRNSQPPQKISPNTIPSGLDRMKLDAASVMNDISGIDDVLGGTASAEFSGVALNQQESRGIRKLMIPMDNLRHTQWILARNLLDLVKDHYKEQRILYITDQSKPEGENREAKVINQRDASGRIVNDITLGEYQVIIGSKPAKDTFNEHQTAELLEYRNAGIAIPDHYMVRYSTIEGKAELEKLLAKQAGFGEMSPEEQKAAQMQIEMEMIQGQADIEKIEAEIRDLEAKADLNEAKADDLRAGENSSDMLKKRMELEGKLAEKKGDQAIRERLALISRETKAFEVEVNSDTEIAKAQLQQQRQAGKPQ